MYKKAKAWPSPSATTQMNNLRYGTFSDVQRPLFNVEGSHHAQRQRQLVAARFDGQPE